jgi:hypothetical protein
MAAFALTTEAESLTVELNSGKTGSQATFGSMTQMGYALSSGSGFAKNLHFEALWKSVRNVRRMWMQFEL